jgi:predicted DNA-binding antitoxin AbrB/MazE fold protein
MRDTFASVRLTSRTLWSFAKIFLSEFKFVVVPLRRKRMSAPSSEKPSVTLPGTVEKVLRPVDPSEPEKAQIAVEGADHLYREIRIANTLEDKDGKPVNLKAGAEVEVTIKADPKATVPSSKS